MSTNMTFEYIYYILYTYIYISMCGCIATKLNPIVKYSESRNIFSYFIYKVLNWIGDD